MDHHQQVSLWLTPCEHNVPDGPPSAMTTAEAAAASGAANVWAEGRFLQQSTWVLRDDRVLPRVGDLVVELYRAALGDRVSLLEVVLSHDSRDHLESAPHADWVIRGTNGSATAVYLLDPLSDQLLYWLDMMLGLDYTWSLATPEVSIEGPASIDARELEDALRNPAVCVTEHDGEILQVSVRDEVAAGRVLRQLDQVARELGFEVIDGP